MTLTGIWTARPPSDVSLYFVFMSWAVAHIERMTASRETLASWRVAAEGDVAGGDGLDGAHRVPLDAGDLHEAADGVAGQAQVVLHGDLGGHQDLVGRAAETWQSPAAAIALETPISAWQPPIAAEIVAPFLNRLPISPAVSRKSSTPDFGRRRRSRRSTSARPGPRPPRRWSGR